MGISLHAFPFVLQAGLAGTPGSGNYFTLKCVSTQEPHCSLAAFRNPGPCLSISVPSCLLGSPLPHDPVGPVGSPLFLEGTNHQLRLLTRTCFFLPLDYSMAVSHSRSLTYLPFFSTLGSHIGYVRLFPNSLRAPIFWP